MIYVKLNIFWFFPTHLLPLQRINIIIKAMSTTISTRPARCADCINFKYYYEGKRKYHLCALKFQPRTLKDRFKVCDNFAIRPGYYPEQYKPN